ncbi:MAG: nitrite/sulfite reductase [Aestuariivita sp.]|nr:nitrite/sulfite reductase [Aestuariivita sp.]
MYKYTEFDKAFLLQRNSQFRAQVQRRINGQLTEEEFKPLRLMNGLYLQLHAYMLRVAIPYGTLNSAQMRQLAYIAQTWDKGYGHFTTRQNIQYNWPKLSDVPDILDTLAEVNLHAIQTSGNTIRNVTADHFAGAAADEICDPRPYAELIRQWSTDHPEFQFLGRKFKIAINGAIQDRAVIRAHDIGLQIIQKEHKLGFKVIVGGGLGRTPMIGKTIRKFLPESDLLPYIEAILSVFNQSGRRDNKYKARIKITVHEKGIEDIRTLVEDRFHRIRPTYKGLDQNILESIKMQFPPPQFVKADSTHFEQTYETDPIFRSWVDINTSEHKADNYVIVSISLKGHGQTPGDATTKQMQVMAQVAEDYGHNELRISHEQNVILPHVHKSNLPQIYKALRNHGLATANIGLISDIIACPGMDYCALATARSIPIAQDIAGRFKALKIEHEIGPLKLKISGCINACGHHHVGHIGILGLERAGKEYYQITIGGDATSTAAIGERVGPGFSAEEIVDAVERLIYAYLDMRKEPEETFLRTYQRVGLAPFKTALYPKTALAA